MVPDAVSKSIPRVVGYRMDIIVSHMVPPRSNDTVRTRPLRHQNEPYTDRNTGRSKTVRFESVPSRIITVLEENTAFLRCRKTVPVITRQNGSFSAVKLPFCHDLHSENAL
jgi:hypothetical protein